MKILFPALHYPPVIGGIEQWTKEIAEGLAKKVDVFVVTGRVKGEPNRGARNGLKVFRTGVFTLKNLSHSPWWYTLPLLFFIYRKSASIIKKEKIGLLHCSGFLSGYLGYQLKKRFNLPYLITIQSLQQSKPLQRCKKRVYTNAAVCIAASEAIAKYFKEIGCQHIEIIPNGIDLSRFRNLDRQASRQELSLQNNEFTIMTVARLEKVKGIEYLIRAIPRIPRPDLGQLPEIGSLSLLIIGEGSERKNLENLVSKLGLQNQVKFLGEIPNEKIPQYLAAADCFCLPSIEEGFGIVVLEAMAVGLPVIASRVGGIMDLVEDGKTGILVEKENSQAIASAIEKIYSQPDFAHRLVENTKAILSRYDWQNIIEQVFNISNNVLRADVKTFAKAGLSEKVDRWEWDDFLKKYEHSHIFNTYEWGEFKLMQGWQPRRLVLEQGGKIKAVFPILEKRAPLLGYKFWYLPRGPVLDFNNKPLVEKAIDFLLERAKENKVVAVKISPDVVFSENTKWLRDLLQQKGFQETKNYQLHKCTVWIDLRPPLEQVLQNFKKNTRWEIRKAQKESVVVSEESLSQFYQLYSQAMRHDRQDFLPYNYLKNLWQKFSKNVFILLAAKQGRVLSGIFVAFFNKRAWYLFGGAKRNQKTYYASQLLHWQAMQVLKNHGITEYDLQGICCGQPKTEHDQGTLNFKLGFGGQRVELIGEYDYIFLPALHKVLFKFAYPIYKQLTKVS